MPSKNENRKTGKRKNKSSGPPVLRSSSSKYPKLSRKTRELASQFISEEIKEKKGGKRKYPRAQAIAIGISRARKATKKRRA